MPVEIALRNVEIGYAEVVRTDTDRRVGHVSRDFMSGSSRSNEMWVAYTGRTRVSSGHTTRADAVAALVAHVQAKDAARAAFAERG